MGSDQTHRPIVETLLAYRAEDPLRMHIPGHKGGRGDSFLGEIIHPSLDLTEVSGLDDLGVPTGAIARAQELAAAFFGSDHAFFLVNGCTAGIQALCLATVRPGEEVILPRNVHRAILGGMILAGAIPVFLSAREASGWPFTLPPSADEVAAAISRHPRAVAVWMVHPDYHGVASDLEDISALVHRRGLTLLVDEAHGSHFGLHPDLPPSSLILGADACVKGMHKTGGALTQAAVLCLRGERVEAGRVARHLALLQTSSPSYLLLASLDAARSWLATEGTARAAGLLTTVREVRVEIGGIPGMRCLGAGDLPPEVRFLDESRLCLDVGGLGLTGTEAEGILRRVHGVQVEYAYFRYLLVVFTLADTRRDGARFANALHGLASGVRDLIPGVEGTERFPSWPGLPSAKLSPREAFLAPSRLVPEEEGVGKIAAVAVVPYPPGIPLFWPGEEITPDALSYLCKAREVGIGLQGIREPGWLEVCA